MNGSEFKGRPLHPWLPGIGHFLERCHEVDNAAADVVLIWDSREAHGYRVDGFIITTQSAVDAWMFRQMDLRHKHQLNDSIVEYKSLKDGRKWRALPDVLKAADELKGTCLVTLIDERYDANRLHEARMVLKKSNFGASLRHRWKEVEFLRVQRIIILLTWIISKVTREGQAIRWLCDEDNMWSSEHQKIDVQWMLGVMSEQALSHKPGEMTFAHYKSGGYYNLIAEELVAIADLAVGGVSDVHCLARRQGFSRPFVFPEPKRGREHSKEEVLADWFWNPLSTPLRRLALVVEDDCNGLVRPRVF